MYRFMTLYALGLNHTTAAVDVREAYALDEASTRAFYQALTLSDEAELILLSTCNRTEAYLFGSEEDLATVRTALSRRARRPWPEADVFLYQDEAAIRHVIEVSCGIRSQVLGDAQILNQMKEAYRLAVDEDRVQSYLHRLMHVTFRTAKRVVNETALTDGIVSVSGAAIAAARLHFEHERHLTFDDQHILIVGAGEMATLALEALQSHGADRICITNRTRAKAEKLAARFGVSTVAWEQRYTALKNAGLVIVATGAPVPTITAQHLPNMAPEAVEKLLVDIAMPRNVGAGVEETTGYRVVDLDAIDQRLAHVEARRRADLPAARQICDEALQEYVTWIFHQQALQPAIDAIRGTFESIRQQEIERHHHRLADTDRQELDRLTKSILQKLLAVPVVRLKNVDPDSIDYVRGIRLLEALFSRPGCADASAEEEAARRRADAATPSSMHPPAACPFGSDGTGARESDGTEYAEGALSAMLRALAEEHNRQP